MPPFYIRGPPIALGRALSHGPFRRNAVRFQNLRDGPAPDSPAGFAVGLGYEFRHVQWVGVGVSGEYMTGGGGARDRILLIPLYVHPRRGLRFGVAPGVEFSDEPEGLHRPVRRPL